MKILCVTPTGGLQKEYIFSLFTEQYEFSYLSITGNFDKVYKFFDKFIVLTFDIFKLLDTQDVSVSNIYDIEVLYRLCGYRFNNLMDLGMRILGEEKIHEYNVLSDKINAHLYSYRVSRVNYKKYKKSEIIPENLLLSFYKERFVVLVELYKHFVQSQNTQKIKYFYDTVMKKNIKSLHNVSEQPISIDTVPLRAEFNFYAEAIKNNLADNQIYLKYNIVGAKTGRLSFRKNTVNVYSLPKNMRKCIVAPRDFEIVQFDYKSLHPRLAIFSVSDVEFKERFKDIEDIYSLFSGVREKNKISFLTWMYSENPDEKFEKEAWPVYKLRDSLNHTVQRTGELVNIFDRVLKFDLHTKKNIIFQNFITSLEVDMMFGLVRGFEQVLRNKKSKILFPFHDALIFQVHKDELSLLPEMKKYMEHVYSHLFSSTFPVEIKRGKNYGEMSEYRL